MQHTSVASNMTSKIASKIDRINYNEDSRVQWRNANLNRRNYAYIYGEPVSGKWKATVFLLHGFPDLAIGWRYQIPHLLNLGFRVVAPDQLGYGRTDAPDDPKEYAFKKIAADLAQLAHQLGESRIVLCAHDWGAALAYSIYHHQHSLISHIITVCVPYSPPRTNYIPLEELVDKFLPSLGYQLQFRSGEVEKAVRSKDDVRQFLTIMYGGRTAEGEGGWSASKGVKLDKLGSFRESPLLKGEDLEYYATEFSRYGIHGPLNWYRLTEINFNDEKQYASTPKIEVPLLFIQALRDPALPPETMGKSMGKAIPDLTVKKLNTSHWALTEDPRGVNEAVEFFLGKYFPDKERSSL
ncbi:epoxide hydrolase, putative [Talaromyces stipitatus ATCC 10500]|uniref:Epoxide hydrolase, putative n=1 Tax=Talaromyces stipitatus (strain ATCC 10500 / CBS 375.48 / QM 6759 / NRRL 1006) TaxID=441959 RepID=B8LY11_TALSN|nr:epoxide hydrolase, putative [Talaromyces stipitatus ATCC 10500]EED22826.1 epoxide hydrolase, putative [Talaromyces stipitatus ATCC 10500]